MSQTWYFAYGSNLNKEQVKERINSFKECGPAILEDYKLTFNIYSPARDGGVADILTSKGDKVYGAVYKMSKEKLYKVEETGLKSGRYKPEQVEVNYNNQKINATAFVVSDKNDFIEPSDEYLKTILNGLRDHGYDENIIEEVKKIGKCED